MSLNTPIIFIIFNRPETTKIVFQKIKKIKPKKLYLIADAPRDGIDTDIEAVIKTKLIVEDIDWECNVFKKYAETNLGCGINVSQGISWVFEHEEMAIILEDDCVPADGFFNYCEELLLKYKNDSRIMHIGGTNWHPNFNTRNHESYFFSKHAHIWGWATWKRSWNLFDYKMSDFPEFIENKYYEDVYDLKAEQSYFLLRWTSFFRSNYTNQSRSNWDYQWYYTVIKNNGLCIWPSTNLISNIGPIGTHSDNSEMSYYFRKVYENYKIEKHPDFVIPYRKLDNYHYWHHNHQSLYFRIKNKLFKIIKNVFKFKS